MKGQLLPEDWNPTQSDLEYGASLGLSSQSVADIAQQMRLWAGANGHRAVARKLNWSMAFKGWMYRATTGNGHGRPANANQVMAALDRLIADATSRTVEEDPFTIEHDPGSGS